MPKVLDEKKARRAHRKQMLQMAIKELQKDDVELGFAIQYDDLGNIVRDRDFDSSYNSNDLGPVCPVCSE